MKNRKIVVGLFVVMIVGVGLCGCLGSSDDPEAEVALFDYELDVKQNFTWVFNEYYTGTIEPNEGQHYIVATIKVVNNAPIDVNTNALMWDLTSDSITYSCSFYTFEPKLADYESVVLEKGGTSTFEIIYEVPLNVTAGTIAYSTFPMPKMVRDDALL